MPIKSERYKAMLPEMVPGTLRGIEFGALHLPVIDPSFDSIRYVDHTSTENLLQKYHGQPSVDTPQIVDVDFVWANGPLKKEERVLGPARVAPVAGAPTLHVESSR